ncbi:MAG TPA: hypothetical protein VJ965_03120, partial [Anaerolineales bacterium]|nr:hypothetical protein [Anaerolineales bacterium]
EPATQTPTEPQAEEPTVVIEPTVTLPAPTATDDGTIPMPALGFEPGDPNLHATTPDIFIRAAGRPQLVELFAFW